MNMMHKTQKYEVRKSSPIALLKIKGEWWFPNDNVKFNGELIFNSKEVGKLTLYGPVESFTISDINRDQLEKTKQNVEKSNICERKDGNILILGKSDDEEKLTLLSTQSLEQRSAIRQNYSFAEKEFKIDFIFTDIHFEKIEDIKFDSILVEYSNSSKWLADNNLRGSDIIKTILAPSESDLIALSVIVAIRIILSWSLSRDIKTV